MTWTLGTVKVYGAGIQIEHFGKDTKKHHYLVVAAGTGEVIVGQHKSSNPATVNLNFVAWEKPLRGGKTVGRSF